MAQNLLTDDQCNRLSNYNELLKTFPGRMKMSSSTFREVINDSNVVGLVIQKLDERLLKILQKTVIILIN